MLLKNILNSCFSNKKEIALLISDYINWFYQQTLYVYSIDNIKMWSFSTYSRVENQFHLCDLKYETSSFFS